MEQARLEAQAILAQAQIEAHVVLSQSQAQAQDIIEGAAERRQAEAELERILSEYADPAQEW